MPHVHFDEDEIRKMARSLVKTAIANESEPGSVGAQARIMAQVMEHWRVALAREMNRGVCPADAMHAVTAVVSNMILGVITSTSGGLEEQADRANFVVSTLAQILTDLLNGIHDGNVGKVMPVAGGHA